jgi:peptidoglycan hydrolase CwlO-like protein
MLAPSHFKFNMQSEQIEGFPGLKKSGDAVVSTDQDALQTYKKQKNFYRRFDQMERQLAEQQEKIERLETEIANLKAV